MINQSRANLTAVSAAFLITASCAPQPETTSQRTYVGEHVTCQYIEVSSDPLGAHVYGPDNSYWGITEEGKPVVRVISREMYWDTTDKEWYGTTRSSNYYTITLKKRAYKATTHSFWLSGRFRTYLGTPEELKAAGTLGKCPRQTEENTNNVLVVLDAE